VFDGPSDRVRMSTAHELGHLVLHRHFSSGTQEMETQAYRFAAELLLPATDIVGDLQSERLNLFRLAGLKQKWKVSMQALARRARDLQVISGRQYTYLMRQMSARGWRTEEPAWGQQEGEKPRALRKMVEVAFGTPINVKRIAGDLHLSEPFVKCVLDMCASAPGQLAQKNHSKGGIVVPFGTGV
jgi:Zn-dependent peptidase ImmA (M78 family)